MHTKRVVVKYKLMPNSLFSADYNSMLKNNFPNKLRLENHSSNTLKYVFGQTSIRAISVLDSSKK